MSDRSTPLTGGQYSLFRVGFGVALLYAWLAWGLDPDADPTIWRRGVGSVAGLLALLLVLGRFDRAAAAGLLALAFSQVGGRELLLPVVLPVGWLLVQHLALPPAPYGSWAARGRADPGGGWMRPRWTLVTSWLVLGAAYLASGLAGVFSWRAGETGLAAAYLLVPLLLLPSRPRPFVWLLLLALQLVLLVTGAEPGWTGGLILLQLATFDPDWLPPRGGDRPDRLFYDGDCGLCHGSVRFALAEDPTGRVLRFAPLAGDAFAAAVPGATRRDLPDSVVVLTHEGRLLVRSAAVVHVLRRLGGTWRVAAALTALVPPAVLDLFYDGVAAVRHRLFRRPAEACPVPPGNLRGRFD